jgi:RNA polymerase sigma-70 factor (ECF subfamily)
MSVEEAALRDTFNRIVKEYSGYVYTLCFRLLWDPQDAQDAAQETFLKLFQNWSRYNDARGLKNWICTIALNAARDAYRNRKARKERITDDGNIDTAPDHTDTRRTIDNRLRVERLLAGLDMKSRSVIVLFYMEQMSIKEIARLMRRPSYLIKVWLYRARRAMLANAGGESE